MHQPIDLHEVFARYFTGCEALAYALSSKLAEGNICLDIEQYKEELRAGGSGNPLFSPTAEAFERQCNHSEFVTRDVVLPRPFVIYKNKAYLHRYFTYETEIINNIKRLNGKFHIITGGPGSGKTYSVSLRLLELFAQNPGIKVALAAPTGKAAARMNESLRKFAEAMDTAQEPVKQKLTALKAQTIHRLLGYISDSIFFRHNEDHPLPYDVVIVDECSMIDGALMAKLLNAVGDNTDIYLLGDKDQLASVEAGSVFGDICRAAASELLQGKVELKTGTRRFDPQKGIGRFSATLIAGGFTREPFAEDEQLRFEMLPESDTGNLFRERVLGAESFHTYA
ncbi:MAG: AAA family ATPase [Bacteroidales bacterium]|nr:AAA family ATPase [Bacteroidales bacterium]